MAELFKTVLILSLLGLALTAVLLCIKPLTVKKFPAKWQYYIWVTVMICMVVPIYKFIPEISVKITDFHEGEELLNIVAPAVIPEVQITDTDSETENEQKVQKAGLKEVFGEVLTLLPYIWISGGCIYLAFAFSSYGVYLFRKKKNSEPCENAIFDRCLSELGIKKKIRLRKASDITSPVLVGVFFPTVYLPQEEIDDEKARMVFLHELTHYKRYDLALKWFSLFVNAIHWFNPLAYVLCRNLSDACEVSCDVAVTKDMSEDEQKLYMKTILDFAR